MADMTISLAGGIPRPVRVTLHIEYEDEEKSILLEWEKPYQVHAQLKQDYPNPDIGSIDASYLSQLAQHLPIAHLYFQLDGPAAKVYPGSTKAPLV